MSTNTRSTLVCLALLLALSAWFYRDTLTAFPLCVHAWSQADRYALALQFADNGLDLFHPRTFDLFPKDGVTAVDLPLHDYIVGVLMKISGSRAPGIFRVWSLLFCCVGYWYLFRLVRMQTDSWLKGMLVVAFVFSAPIIVYYQAGFIPSATSLAAVWIGYYYWFRYQKSAVLRDFYAAMVCFVLAAASRMPFHMFLFAVVLQQCLVWGRSKQKWPPRAMGAIALAYGFLFSAYLYKTWLAATYGSIFLSNLMPAESPAQFMDLLHAVWVKWRWQLFTIGHYGMIAGAVLTLLYVWLRRLPLTVFARQILLQSVLALAGAGCYFVVMTRQFVDHEYYFMDSFYVGVVLLVVAGITVLSWEKVNQKVVFGLILSSFCALGVYQSRQVQIEKYTPGGDRGEVTRRNFWESAHLLDSLGVPADAKMLVIDAYSFNIPLILMNRSGYPLLSTSRTSVEAGLKLPFDYVVVQDIYFPSDVVTAYPDIIHHLTRVGGDGRISIFKYHATAQPGDLAQTLGIQDPVLVSTCNFTTPPTDPAWKFPEKPWTDTSATEYGPGFYRPVGTAPFNRVLWEGQVRSDQPDAHFSVVTSVERDGKSFFYDRTEWKVAQLHHWDTYTGLFILPDSLPPDAQLKCYLWNNDRALLRVDSLKVTLFAH